MKAPGIDKSNSLDRFFLFPKFLSWTLYGICAQILVILFIYNWLATKSDTKRVTLAHELKCRITCAYWQCTEMATTRSPTNPTV